MILRHAAPISAANRAFIDARRLHGDAAIADILRDATAAFPAETRQVEQSWERVRDLRTAVKAAFVMPGAELVALRARWLTAANELVAELEMPLRLASQIESADFAFAEALNMEFRVIRPDGSERLVYQQAASVRERMVIWPKFQRPSMTLPNVKSCQTDWTSCPGEEY